MTVQNEPQPEGFDIVYKCEPLAYWIKESKKLGMDEFIRNYPEGFLVLEEQPPLVDCEIDVKTNPSVSGTAPGYQLPPGIASHFQGATSVIHLKKSDRNSYSTNITIGRARNNDIVIRSGKISKVHAALIPKDSGRYHVQDMKSLNGTFINGLRIESKKSIPIVSGDRVAIWRFGFRYLSVMDFQSYLRSQK